MPTKIKKNDLVTVRKPKPDATRYKVKSIDGMFCSISEVIIDNSGNITKEYTPQDFYTEMLHKVK